MARLCPAGRSAPDKTLPSAGTSKSYRTTDASNLTNATPARIQRKSNSIPESHGAAGRCGAPGHFPAEAQRTTDEARRSEDFFAVQTAGTVSFRTGLVGRFLCSGLEYQVEHHLFPNVSHVHYPEISVAVQKFCAEQGLPYRSYSWAGALWKSWEVLRFPQQIVGREHVPTAVDAVSSSV